jgi:hypothetical protein
MPSTLCSARQAAKLAGQLHIFPAAKVRITVLLFLNKTEQALVSGQVFTDVLPVVKHRTAGRRQQADHFDSGALAGTVRSLVSVYGLWAHSEAYIVHSLLPGI